MQTKHAETFTFTFHTVMRTCAIMICITRLCTFHGGHICSSTSESADESSLPLSPSSPPLSSQSTTNAWLLLLLLILLLHHQQLLPPLPSARHVGTFQSLVAQPILPPTRRHMGFYYRHPDLPASSSSAGPVLDIPIWLLIFSVGWRCTYSPSALTLQ